MNNAPGSLPETHSIGANTREWLVALHGQSALMQYGIPLTGWSEAVEGFRFVRRDCGFSQVLACYAGKGAVLINGRWRTCREGMAYFTPPTGLHAYHALPGVRWGVCWCHHQPGLGQAPLVTSPGPVLARVDPRPLNAAIAGLYQESIGSGESLAMKAWLELIHLYASRMTRPWHSEDRLWRLWEAVSGSLARSWTLCDLAAQAALSTEHLRRLCLKQCGHSPMQHLASLRMRQAAALLTLNDRKVDAIARSVGYGNCFAFSTAFKRYAGLSPAQYRKHQCGHVAKASLRSAAPAGERRP